MKIPCPQCGGEVQLREAAGFVDCPFCGTSLVLDLTGVRPHMLYRPRHGPADVAPLLRRWCDAQGLPAPSRISTPRMVYQPFWRFASQGRPRMVPAWPAHEACWADTPIPDADQILYHASVVGAARVVEADVAEAAARARLFGERAAAAAAGDLVHIPFYEVQAMTGSGRLAALVEACSGRVYPERMPPGATTATARQTASAVKAIAGLALMFLEALLIPPGWLAAVAVALTAVVLYWTVVGSTQSSFG